MQRTSFARQQCPVARALDCVGEWWSIVILRDAFHGLSRFDEFQESLGIAPNMLSRRLKALVKNGMLERRIYQRRPTRYAYALTTRGRDFFPVILTLVAWGNRYLAPNGIAVGVRDRATGKPVHPIVVDSRTLKRLTGDTIKLAAGPAAGPAVRARVERVNRLRGADAADAADATGGKRQLESGSSRRRPTQRRRLAGGRERLP
jgi:DNA-binding HxlR family transcriptional regulator